MKKDIAVNLQNISKVYKLYDKPIDRLKESLHPLKKRYHKDFYALKNINLEIKKGEVLGIVGVNGAGKSTLLKIIAGVLTPTSGRVNIHGRLNAILELSSGLKGELTGRENIKLNLKINGIEKKEIDKLTKEIVEFADIGEHIDQPVKTYSSGMKSRLGFGIATSTDPDVLIVDEVLAVGDVLFKRKCYSKIENLFKDGKTVIFVSHSAQSVVEFCSRAVLLYDREIIMDDTPKKVTDYYQKLVFSKDKKTTFKEIQKEITKKPLETKKEQVLRDGTKYFDKTLVAKPLIKVDGNIKVYDYAIYDSNGNKVNILKKGNKYTYSYKIRSDKNIKNVTCGAGVKTKQGINTSWIIERFENGISLIAGKEYQFEAQFDCLFYADYYFTTAGVRTLENELLHQELDTYVFKVEPLGSSKYLGGIFDTGWQCAIKENYE